MDLSGLIATFIGLAIMAGIVGAVAALVYSYYRKRLRAEKDYERALKMVQIRIQLPPGGDDKDSNRDVRDVADEAISQAQKMYNIISSTATKGFHSRIYGQRHMSFEIVADDGVVRFYAVVPYLLVDNVKQAIMAAYPTARLEEVEEINLFSEAGKLSGTLGGELTLNKPYMFPIATYKDSKQDAMGAILNAMTQAQRGDGMGVQILLRPAREGWSKKIDSQVQDIKDGKKGASSGKNSGIDLSYFGQILEALWKPPTSSDKEKESKPLSGSDQARVEMMEEKSKYSGYEVMIRLIVSTASSGRSQALLTSLQSAFALFNSATGNSFKFTPTNNIQEFITAYIMRFFPASRTSDILNTVELASIFHLPNQTNIPSSQVEQQMTRQISGPTQPMDPNGLLLGYNYFRGVKKEIRLSKDDRRRHVYVMGSTGMGKSVFLKNMALQDMRAGRGLAFVDPHGDAAEELLEMVPKNRVDDVIYFNPDDREYPIGMNLFEIEPNDPDPERTQDYVISETNNMLMSLYDPNNQGIVGPRMTNIVRNAALLVMADPKGGTFMDIPKVLNDPDFAKPKIKYLKNQRAIDFWTKEWPNLQKSNEAGDLTNWVVSKWSDFETGAINSILGQTHSSLNIREIMDDQKILLVNLSKGKLGDLPAKLLGMIFVMKFQAAAMSRVNIPEDQRKDFCLYVDEFQNFATESFSTILSEARKYRLNLMVVNQFMGQLTDNIRSAILANVGSYVIGRCGTEDVDEVAKVFYNKLDNDELLSMPNYTAVSRILIDGTPTDPFTMNLPAPMGRPNVELGKALAKKSALKYGKPREQVEAEMKKRWSTVKPTPARRPANSSITPKSTVNGGATGNAFLDNWLAKRQQMMGGGTSAPSQTVATRPTPTFPQQPGFQLVSSVPPATPTSLRPLEPSNQTMGTYQANVNSGQGVMTSQPVNQMFPQTVTPPTPMAQVQPAPVASTRQPQNRQLPRQNFGQMQPPINQPQPTSNGGFSMRFH